jgi:hypothetical protein|tara:strand:+ start:1763 stop:2164 length:402 start_codon:yes stop_codon:yes gene_type:complete
MMKHLPDPIENYFPQLNNQNMMFYMAVHYADKQGDGSDEFFEDINRIKYIKRLISKYYDTGELKTRLLMNHLLVLVNLFGGFACTRILMYRIDAKYHEIIVTFLNEINALSPQIKEIVTINKDVQELIRADMR